MSDATHISETVSAGQLRAFIERIERVEEEIKTLNGDKSEIYKELRGCGFDVKAVRQCVAARKLDSAEREERNAIFDLYWAALTGASRVHVHEGRDDAGSSSGRIAEFDSADAGSNPAPVTIDPETGEITEHEQPETPADEIHERPSTNDKAYLEAVPQDEASLAGTGSRMLAGREGRSEGEAASADLPTHSNPQPSSSPGADKPEAVSPPAVSGVLSDDDVPAFLKRDHASKAGCLKLKDGHCKIGFATSALCAECNAAKARVSA